MEPPEFEDYECRYVCGTCGSDTVAMWSEHRAHYGLHQAALQSA